MIKQAINESFLGRTTDSLMSLLYSMNVNMNGISFICDDVGRFCGVITNGDIRRSLLAGHTLNEKAETIMNRAAIVASPGETEASVAGKFCSNIQIIPVLDSNQKVTGYYKREEGVPIADPYLNGNELNYLLDAFVSTWISSRGHYISQFEEQFSAYCGSRYGVAVSNGTAALHTALLALGVKEGDEVIVPDLTFAATINAVLYTGATPVIVDIEEDSWCISPKAIEEAITPATKAIIPVHLYGQPCDMGIICSIAEKYHLFIIEDCAEAHGAMYRGKKVGSFGDIGCFSFFGNKVITTGEGGMCVTDSAELDDRMRKYRDHGMSRERRYYHDVIGYNYRMTNLQAAVGVGQLERIDRILQWRDKLEVDYRSALGNIPGIVLQENSLAGRKKIAWLISVLVDAQKRDLHIARLKQRGIDCRAFFVPLSEMPIYKKYAPQPCTVSAEVSRRGINLPTNYRVTGDVIREIAEELGH